MKKAIYVLTILLFFSCDWLDEEDDCSKTNARDAVWCLGVYTVDIWFNETVEIWYNENPVELPEGLIIAEDGYSAKLGTTLAFEALSVPGLKFIGWSKRKACYGCYQPLIDDENPNIAYVYMHEKYHGNSNIGPENVQIVANYIKTLE